MNKDAVYKQLKDVTMYFRNLSKTATVEFIKEGQKIIGYIAYQTTTADEMKELLVENDEEDFTLPEHPEFLYLEAFEILKPFQDKGYGTKAFLDFKKKINGVIIYQFTDLSEYFWDRFNTKMVDGADWWAYLEN